MNKKRSHNIFPFLQWLPDVTKRTILADLIAGLTGAVIVLPQGVAFAMIAGLPPIYGLYTAMITPIVAALFGSSRHLISGPTTAISIVVFAAISQFAEPGTNDFITLALTLTFMAGLMQFTLGLARMGTLINFVSHTVVIGFTAGAALLIGTSQMKHVLGINLENGGSFLHTWVEIIWQIPQTNFYVAGIAAATLLVAVVIKKLIRMAPNLLIAMVAGSLLCHWLHGAEHGVKLVGEMPAQLPPLSLPDFSISTFSQLAPNAFAIALLGLIEAVTIARSIATRSIQRIDGNQEFIGQGLSNMVGSFFSSYAGSGSFTRSGINFEAGAKTPLAAIFAAGMLMAIVLLVAPLMAYLPMPAMGGIILLVAYNLIDFHHIKTVLKASKREAIILGMTFFSTLFLELEFAIYVGVIFSLIFYLQRTSTPRIVTIAPNQKDEKRKFLNVDLYEVSECLQLKIIRIDGSLFYGAVDHIAAFLNELTEAGHRNILIVGSGINFTDITGAELLVNEAKRWRSLGGQFFVCGLKKPTRDLLQWGGYWKAIGEENTFITKQLALKNIYPKLDKSICAKCERKTFVECVSTSEAG